MAKNILFFADGTWNGPDRDDDGDGPAEPSNVFKLFGLLDRQDDLRTLGLRGEQERHVKKGDSCRIAYF
jgi:hypothetical protein